MREVVCSLGDSMYITKRNMPLKLEPWDCPNCTRDSLKSIQRDVNFLHKKFNYRATLSVLERLDRLWRKQYLFPTSRDTFETVTFF